MISGCSAFIANSFSASSSGQKTDARFSGSAFEKEEIISPEAEFRSAVRKLSLVDTPGIDHDAAVPVLPEYLRESCYGYEARFDHTVEKTSRTYRRELVLIPDKNHACPGRYG